MGRVLLIFSLLVLAAGPARAADAPRMVAASPAAQAIAGAVAAQVRDLPLLSGPNDPRLKEADLVFWIGPELESWLPARHLPPERLVTLSLAEGVTRLPRRDAPARPSAPVWLDIPNVRAMAQLALAALQGAEPHLADLYARGHEDFTAGLDVLRQDLALVLAAPDGGPRPFLVAGDGSQYFEGQFQLFPAAPLTPDAPPAGAAAGARCVVLSGPAGAGLDTGDRATASLDLEGAAIPLRGAHWYGALMHGLAAAYSACLAANWALPEGAPEPDHGAPDPALLQGDAPKVEMQ